MQSEPSWEIRLYKLAKRMFLSTFVVFSFLAYVVHEKFVSLTTPETVAVQPPQTPQTSVPPQAPTQAAPIIPPANDDDEPVSPPTVIQPQPSQAPTQAPTTVPTDPPIALGQYKDGVYTGPEIDAYFGLVQVQATVQNGQIASVDFLEFPQDRRTSQRINAQAVPYLKMEAVQAQSANVNIISGATLTSEAFIMSLQSALNSAKP